VSSARSRRPTAAILVLVVATAVAPWTAAVLFALSRFGQSPPEVLPWAVVVLLGALLSAPAAAAAAHLPRRAGAALAGIGATLAVAAAVLAGLPAAYLGTLPPLLLGLALLRSLPGERPELYGAALVYVGCTVLANFTLDSFIPLGDFLLINVGTLFFGITFTQRDRLHRFGRRVVYRVILLAAAANVAVALAIGTPLRYVAVSFLAIVISEAADTEVYHRLLHRRWIARVAGSNAVSAPLDTILFTTLAFAGAPFATAAWMTQVIVTDVVVKYAASMVAAVTLLSRPAWVPKAPPAEAGGAEAGGAEAEAPAAMPVRAT
jgi:queuosine precursor transporter